MAERLLVLGNKKYSSWSLRAWIGLMQAGLPFRERVIKLFRPETAAEIGRYSPALRVPVLVDDGLTVHDSLAILEYVNEAYGEGRLWPANRAARARARSVSAEMHAGFPNLRARLPMNLARDPAPLPARWAVDAPTQAELDRVRSLWEGLLRDSGGPFLFGEWSIADCMYLPVATRLRTYAVELSAHPLAEAYVRRMLALPAFLRWEADGRAEPEEHPDYAR
jgi:glutathione S-transferase